jgi:hypothetical protein
MRDRDLRAGAGARHAIARGLVGTGDALPSVPRTIDDAVAAAASAHGAKAGRMLRRFDELAIGSFVWTRTAPETYHLGRITGRWRYDDSAAARKVGIHHVRPARWLERPLRGDEVPAAVTATFARGGRNLQRIHDREAEHRTASLWDALTGAGA